MSTGTGPDLITQTKTAIGGLLDRGFTQATGPVIRAVTNGSISGLMAQRLNELEAEAARLAEAGKQLTADNPVVRALLADFEDTMRGNASLINSAAPDVQQTGIMASGQAVRQTALPGMSDQALRVIGIQWNTPDPAAIAQVVNYTGGDAWAEMLSKYPSDVVNVARNAIIKGVVMGQGPVQTARDVRRVIEGLPAYQAQNLMRTLQLTSYRDAGVMHRVANADILAYQVRIAALDSRTCLCCVSLHGTRLPIDARIDDHQSGRCDSISVVKGQQAPDIMTGEEWFSRLPEEQQRAQMGNAAFDAWKSGAIQMRDFVQPYTDPVFGQMVREASLKGMLGDGAKTFYGGDNNPDSTLGARNRVALYEARNITPAAMEAGTATGPLADELFNMFAYTDNGDPTFSKEMIGQYKDDLLYNVYTLGRGTVPERTLYAVRQQSAAALRADEYLNGAALSRKERNLLTRMASSDNDKVQIAIDQIRDRRISGNLDSRAATSTRTYSETFTSIADEEGAARLRENRR